MTSSWFFLSTPNHDARSTNHTSDIHTESRRTVNQPHIRYPHRITMHGQPTTHQISTPNHDARSTNHTSDLQNNLLPRRKNESNASIARSPGLPNLLRCCLIFVGKQRGKLLCAVRLVTRTRLECICQLLPSFHCSICLYIIFPLD